MTLWISAFKTCFFIAVCPSVTGEYSVKKVILGEPVTLYCDGKSTSDEFEVTWKTPHQLVAQISKGHFSCGPGFENRVRFENVQSKGGFSLHLSPTVFSDTDMYSCFTGADLMKTWNLIVTASPTEEVTVIERGTVTVPCYSLVDRQLAYDKLNIQWRKDGKVVLNLTEGTTHHYPDLEFRANIFLDEIRKGDLSLVIKDIQITDEGNYECLTGKGIGDVLSSVKVHVKKGPKHGYRQRVLHYAGDSFTFFVSTDDVEIYHFSTKIDDKKQICKVRETGATCHEDVQERAYMHQGYLTLNDLTKNDEGTYIVVHMDKTMTEIVLEVWQLPSARTIVTLNIVAALLFIWFIRRKSRKRFF